jgi:hypothetical protein
MLYYDHVKPKVFKFKNSETEVLIVAYSLEEAETYIRSLGDDIDLSPLNIDRLIITSMAQTESSIFIETSLENQINNEYISNNS